MIENEVFVPEQQEIIDAITKDSDPNRNVLTKAVSENLADIVQGMIARAKGIWIREIVVNKDGIEVEVPAYQEKPDVLIGQYLINQLLGRPTEAPETNVMKQNVIVQNEIKIVKYDRSQPER